MSEFKQLTLASNSSQLDYHWAYLPELCILQEQQLLVVAASAWMSCKP